MPFDHTYYRATGVRNIAVAHLAQREPILCSAKGYWQESERGRRSGVGLVEMVVGSLWPTAEIDFKPGKLLAQKFAEFAAGSFTAL